MSLNLNYTGIANWEDVCLIDDPTIGRKVEHPFNFTMGILLMHTGINTITRQNASEFYMRAKLIEACCGALFTNADGTPRYLDTEDVANYIGLSSNVSSATRRSGSASWPPSRPIRSFASSRSTRHKIPAYCGIIGTLGDRAGCLLATGSVSLSRPMTTRKTTHEAHPHRGAACR
jgi:hypothetical protein